MANVCFPPIADTRPSVRLRASLGAGRMHIHLPKPLHGWRQFVGEVGIIVLGVLIALGAEQLVQTWRLRSEARGFRKVVDHELALNFGAFQFNQSQRVCIRRRLDELQTILDRSRSGETVHLTGKISAPVEITAHIRACGRIGMRRLSGTCRWTFA